VIQSKSKCCHEANQETYEELEARTTVSCESEMKPAECFEKYESRLLREERVLKDFMQV
jgi:hypothetical protein